MRFIKKISFLSVACFVAYMPLAFGIDLVGAYHDALLNSPTLRAAIANRRVQSHLPSEAMAGFLPHLEARYDTGYQTSRTNVNENLENILGIDVKTRDNLSGHDFNIELLQPIFNYKSIIDYQLAEQAQIIADYQLVDAEQKLMVDVSKKYFAILTLQDKLTAVNEEKKYLSDQLIFMQKKVSGGLESQLNADEVKTSINLVDAERIDLESKLRAAITDLKGVTGNEYQSFQHLSPKFVPTNPKPEHLSDWMDAVQKGNLDLHMENANLDLVRKEIQQAGAGGYPQLNAVAGYEAYNGLMSVLGTQQVSQISSTVGMQLKVPLFEGGYDANKQAEAKDKLGYEYAHYDEIKAKIYTGTESLFGGIQALVMKVQADQSAEDNAGKAVDFATKAYEAGLRGSVDILAAQKALYQAESDYSEDLYHYLGAALELKQLAGILRPKDLQEINERLQTSRVIDKQDIDLV